MRADKPPFNDVRVRRAISMALDRTAIIDSTLEGVGTLNAAVPLALKEWALPVEQLGEGAQYYKHDPAGPGGSWPRPASRTGSRPPSTSPPTAPRS